VACGLRPNTRIGLPSHHHSNCIRSAIWRCRQNSKCSCSGISRSRRRCCSPRGPGPGASELCGEVSNDQGHDGTSSQRLYRPDASSSYPQLAPVLSKTIDWELIAQQYDPLVKYTTALRLGTGADGRHLVPLQPLERATPRLSGARRTREGAQNDFPVLLSPVDGTAAGNQ
jgi:Tn3 transposase DDE domain